MDDVRSFCRRVLEEPDLEAKLRPPRDARGQPLCDDTPGAPLHINAPARSPELQMTTGVGPLPRPGALGSAAARAVCLARFAHHELMAVELFAWALLRWPDLPTALRRGFLGALGDEQKHCRLYLGRLAAHGASLGDYEHNDYFWKHAEAIADSPHGAQAFLAAMGLTLEQANLDFTLTYRDAFLQAGDQDSARVCQVVHDDEINHVRLAAEWLPRIAPATTSGEAGHDGPYNDIEVFDRTVPYPLEAARAKGRRFEVAPRRAAGLSDEFIEHVRSARSSQESGLPRRAPARRDS